MKKREILLGLLLAILLILSFPCFDLEFLAWFALVPLSFLWRERDYAAVLSSGSLTAIIAFLGILYWIIVAVHTYGNVPLIPSGLILLLLVGATLSLFYRAFTLLTRLIQIRSGLETILFTPLLWVALEHLCLFLLSWVHLLGEPGLFSISQPSFYPRWRM